MGMVGWNMRCFDRHTRVGEVTKLLGYKSCHNSGVDISGTFLLEHF